MEQQEVRSHDPGCAALVGDHAYCDCTANERHPSCDLGCTALRNPQTKAELRAALDHWMYHPYLSGCSHGC
jgi:hypothetical protein